MKDRVRHRRRICAVPPPTIPRDPKPGKPPGPHSPQPDPTPTGPPPAPRREIPEQRRDKYRQSEMYPTLISVWPDETCAHGLHGAVTAA
jgi:hypothetical protein